MGTAIMFAGAAVVVYIALKVVPVYLNNYFIEGIFEEEAQTFGRQSASDIYNEIAKKLKDMNHPCDPRLVTIKVEDSSITISAQYTETVEFLGGYKKSFTFSPTVVKLVQKSSKP